MVDLLMHLKKVSFAGAPDVVGNGFDDEGRLAVRWAPGVSAHPHAWTDEGAARVGTLLRAQHDATGSYRPLAGSRWQATWVREVRSDDVVFSHCDTGPWNVVGGSGLPEIFIDWEYAGPVARQVEVAQTTWLNAQLHDDDIADMHGLPDASIRARQARCVLDGYGVATDRRESMVDLMIELAVHGARSKAQHHAVTPSSTEAVASDGYLVMWGIVWRARSASWMLRNRGLLIRCSHIKTRRVTDCLQMQRRVSCRDLDIWRPAPGAT